MKLIDCFMYFDEDLVLDIRLNTLADKVDKFIVVEATKNHAGQEKKLNFKINNFLKFKDKIHYLIIDDLPANVKSPKKDWHENHARDQFQRNSISRGYQEYHDNDLIKSVVKAVVSSTSNSHFSPTSQAPDLSEIICLVIILLGLISMPIFFELHS